MGIGGALSSQHRNRKFILRRGISMETADFLVAIALVSANAVSKRAAVAIIPTHDCNSKSNCVKKCSDRRINMNPDPLFYFHMSLI